VGGGLNLGGNIVGKYARGIIDITDLPADLAAGDVEAAALYGVLVSEGFVNDTDDLAIFCEDAGHIVSEDAWLDYVRDLGHDALRDRGADSQAWPAYCIDWEWAARELAHDYAAFDVGGVIYFVRAW
jgi:hypothetical protein